MLLIPVTAYVIYSSGSYTLEELASIIYEEAAPIWFVLILQWCLSIDFDSNYHMQIMTYPVARWKYLLERLLFSTVIFIGLLSIVALILAPFHGSFVWQGLAFTIPVYTAFAGFLVAKVQSSSGVTKNTFMCSVTLSPESLIFQYPV